MIPPGQPGMRLCATQTCRRVLAFLLLCIFPACAAAPSPQPPRSDRSLAEPLAIVVNLSNPVTNLSIRELKTIFLGERGYWPSGRRITLVLRDLDAPERRTIIHDICGMNEDQFRNHVLRSLFTGEMLVSPKTLSSPSGVRRFIVNVPGAIGFLRLSDVDDSIRVLRIDDLLPADKGYELHFNPAGDSR